MFRGGVFGSCCKAAQVMRCIVLNHPNYAYWPHEEKVPCRWNRQGQLITMPGCSLLLLRCGDRYLLHTSPTCYSNKARSSCSVNDPRNRTEFLAQPCIVIILLYCYCSYDIPQLSHPLTGLMELQTFSDSDARSLLLSELIPL